MPKSETTPLKARPARAKDTPIPARKPGRKRVSGRPIDSQSVGRQAIIDATVALLKTRTPEQLTILEVANAAGVARTLVRYYFGDLKGLLREVTEDLILHLQDRTEALLRHDGALVDRVHQRLTLLVGFLREHPQFQRLALTETYFADSGVDSPADTAGNAKSTAAPAGKRRSEVGPGGTRASHALGSTPLQRVARRGLQLTTMLLDETRAAHVDPRYIHLSILAIAYFIAPAQPLLTTLFGTGNQGRKQGDDYLRFVAQVLADRMEKDR